VVGQVRGPQVFVALSVGSRPRSAVGKRSAHILPGCAIDRGLQANAVGCEGSKICAIGFLDYRGVVDEGISLDWTRVDVPFMDVG